MSEQPREPLSEARLAAITAGIADGDMGLDEDGAYFAIRDLLADNARLRVELAAAQSVMMRLIGQRDVAQGQVSEALEIVRAVAEASTTWTGESEYVAISALRYPGRETSRQLRDKARAVLASEAQARGEAAEPDSGEEGAG